MRAVMLLIGGKESSALLAEFTGNVLMLLREAMNFVKSNTKRGWEKLPDGRKNKPEYAERAVLEAMINHFIHRDYTVMGSEVHLDIYDDRLTVTSPGGMYSGQTVQDLSLEEIASDRKNPILADVMAQLDYMEKRGSGLKRICIYNKSLRLVLLHVFVLSIKKQTVPTLPYRDCCMLDHRKTYRISV